MDLSHLESDKENNSNTMNRIINEEVEILYMKIKGFGNGDVMGGTNEQKLV